MARHKAPLPPPSILSDGLRDEPQERQLLDGGYSYTRSLALEASHLTFERKGI